MNGIQSELGHVVALTLREDNPLAEADVENFSKNFHDSAWDGMEFLNKYLGRSRQNGLQGTSTDGAYGGGEL